jgi:polysaccharide biosynthesis protein PslH
MSPERLSILHASQMPSSPPRFGAQARMHGLMTGLARRHDLTAISLVDEEFDVEECRRAMSTLCSEVILLPNPRGRGGLRKRFLQVRSLVSPHSFEHLLCAHQALQRAIDACLRRKHFDVVNLEFPYLAHFNFRLAGTKAPPLVLDTHEIAYDMGRQFARGGSGAARRLYGELNWRKLRREEIAAFRKADGICACSVADQQRLLADVPSARTVVIPNAADVDFYRPRPADPPADGRTVVFFGLMSTRPNLDGAGWFVREIWPRILAARPNAACKIIGKGAPKGARELVGPRVEAVGFIEDLRPHLASAGALVVPLRLGGGTRLKIVEGMAMGKAIVSTALGAEGIDVVPDRDILLADDPDGFARAVVRLLADPSFAARIGASARRVAVERYAWSAASAKLEQFYREVIDGRPAQRTPAVQDWRTT